MSENLEIPSVARRLYPSTEKEREWIELTRCYTSLPLRTLRLSFDSTPAKQLSSSPYPRRGRLVIPDATGRRTGFPVSRVSRNLTVPYLDPSSLCALTFYPFVRPKVCLGTNARNELLLWFRSRCRKLRMEVEVWDCPLARERTVRPRSTDSCCKGGGWWGLTTRVTFQPSLWILSFVYDRLANSSRKLPPRDRFLIRPIVQRYNTNNR